MNRRTFFCWLSSILTIALGLSACQTAPAIVSAAAADFVPKQVGATDCSYGGLFKSVEALDQLTVKFTLCSPDPAFLSKLAFPVFAIQDERYLNATGGSSVKMSVEPNVSGPYRVKEWVKGDHLTLEANPNYWGAPPKSKTLIVRWKGNPEERYTALVNKQVDGIDNVDPSYYTSILYGNDPELYYRPPMNVLYMGMNNTIPPFNDIRVRQAIGMMINRQRVIDHCFAEGSRVADQFVPPSIRPGFTDNLRWYTYLPEKARSLLIEAGFDFNQELVLSYRDVSRSYMPKPACVATEIQTQLYGLGLNVRTNVNPDLLTPVAAGQEAFFLLGWGADYPDATNFYNFHFSNSSKRFGEPYPKLAEAIELGGKIADARQRQLYYDQVNQLIKEYVPMVPLAYGISAMSFRADVQGVVVGPLNENFEDMSTPNDTLIFMQGAEPRRLWCGDETDGENSRICALMYSSLLRYKFGTAEVEPALAEYWESNEELTEWTFYLRSGVKFSNGNELDANDVVATFSSYWDAGDVNHVGDTGQFEYFAGFFGDFINKPQP